MIKKANFYICLRDKDFLLNNDNIIYKDFGCKSHSIKESIKIVDLFKENYRSRKHEVSLLWNDKDLKIKMAN